MYHGSSLVKVWLEGLFDTMVVYLPKLVVGAVVGLIHSVLLASNTHSDMCVPLGKVQSMNMKPMNKERSCMTDVMTPSWLPSYLSSCCHSPQVEILSPLETLLMWFLTEQTRCPETSCFRVMTLVSLFPERSSASVTECPSRVQLYWGLSPPSEEQDTLFSPWDRHSETRWTEDTGAERPTHWWLLITR